MNDSILFRAKFGTPAMVDKAQHSPHEDERSEVAERHPDRHAAMLNDPSHEVRASIARHKNPAHLDHFVNKIPHDHWQVSAAIARNGDPKHLDKLVDHPHSIVRGAVAARGLDRHHDVMVHDKEAHVRRSVAINGSEKHRSILKHDPDSDVRFDVLSHTENPETIEHLKKDPDDHIREVAHRRQRDIDDSHRRTNAFLDKHGHELGI